MHPEAYLFFARRPEEIPLWEALEAAVTARFPGCTLRVQKTQITFDAPGVFACVSLPRRRAERGIVISFSLSTHVCSDRIIASSEIRPGRWTHHVLLRCAEEIDAGLMDWLSRSHAMASPVRRNRSDV